MNKKFLIVCYGILLANFGYAAKLEQCFNIASSKYQIPSKLLKAIAQTETKQNPLAIHVNDNHTYDIGIMQINSTWLPKLKRVGIHRIDLLDGCSNIQIGAWILAQNIKQYGFNLKAIGAYNSSIPEIQKQYAETVLSNLEK